jgi:hypothetical protein
LGACLCGGQSKKDAETPPSSGFYSTDTKDVFEAVMGGGVPKVPSEVLGKVISVIRDFGPGIQKEFDESKTERDVFSKAIDLQKTILLFFHADNPVRTTYLRTIADYQVRMGQALKRLDCKAAIRYWDRHNQDSVFANSPHIEKTIRDLKALQNKV